MHAHDDYTSWIVNRFIVGPERKSSDHYLFEMLFLESVKCGWSLRKCQCLDKHVLVY